MKKFTGHVLNVDMFGNENNLQKFAHYVVMISDIM